VTRTPPRFVPRGFKSPLCSRLFAPERFMKRALVLACRIVACSEKADDAAEDTGLPSGGDGGMGGDANGQVSGAP